MNIVVTGAGGFIGHHLVKRLKEQGHNVGGIDVKHPEFELSPADFFNLVDCRKPWIPPDGTDRLYMLAADMGGMGFIQAGNDARIMVNNQLINIQSLTGANIAGVGRVLFTSSACVYPNHLQRHTQVVDEHGHGRLGLTEDMAFPADPQDGYGWEKLTTEKLCGYFSQNHNLDTRVVRFHNIYGPLGTWQGGREKAPAALCRKIAEAKLKKQPFIEVWGDGEQTRSFCYIDDCVTGLIKLMECEDRIDWQAINLGSEEMVSINQLARVIMDAAGYECEIRHIDGPQGVRGRNSDNTRLREVLNWEPHWRLDEGIAETYEWVEQGVRGDHK